MAVASGQTDLLSLRQPHLPGVAGTFAQNKAAPVHRWYPYLEGYSASFVASLLAEFARQPGAVYDPFAGSGTTPYVASQLGFSASYCEVNPFMRLVIDAKTNGVRAVRPRVGQLATYFAQLRAIASSSMPCARDAAAELEVAFGGRPYFEVGRLREIVALRRAVTACEAPDDAMRYLALVVLGSIAVESSELVRAGDLRYRKSERELRRRAASPLVLFDERCGRVVADIAGLEDPPCRPVELASRSALEKPDRVEFYDIVLTSPPYLNGTNYFRNTKLELWITGLIEGEGDLRELRDQAVTAGINGVAKGGRPVRKFDCVEGALGRLDDSSYDPRIPELIRRYFSDASLWLANIRTVLRPNGHALIDIGDSRFAGQLISTERLLAAVAADAGLELVENRPVRARRSKDGSPLKQVLLVLRPSTGGHASHGLTLADKAKKFERELPHKDAPLKARNWGHGWHSLCSYQGKLKPAIAHTLVKEFTNEGEIVLDPMSGAGTIPLEASLQGRVAWGNDLQELGYILTAAKVGCPSPTVTMRIVDDLVAEVEARADSEILGTYSQFGMNGKVSDYFHHDTYAEVLAARRYVAAKPVDSPERALVYSALLHILHGNRPYALSRRSHPVTPFKPAGPTDYRPLAPRLVSKVERALSQDVVKRMPGRAFNMDLFDLGFESEVDAVITSPPFAASTRFFVANWMRLWMAGWEPSDFESRRAAFLEERQKDGLSIYTDFFRAAARWLRPGGRLIMHVGRNGRVDMASELVPRCLKWFSLVSSFDEDVGGREKFGIRDQGTTVAHQYLFLERR